VSRMSKKCVPYTPFTGKLSEATVALVSTAGVHRKDQPAFHPDGDPTYRIIPGDTDTRELMATHGHYDTTDANTDINCVFPLDRLRELAAEGTVGGVGNKHIGAMGFSMKLKQMYEEVAPAIAKEVERSSADLVVLTGG